MMAAAQAQFVPPVLPIPGAAFAYLLVPLLVIIAAQTKDEPRQRLEHAYGMQRFGQYAEAVKAYPLALASLEDPSVDVELNYGTCLMATGRWGEAEHLMMRIADKEPMRWQAQYNLGVVRAITGDAVGAQIALERLRPLNDAMADALESQYVRGLDRRSSAVEDREKLTAAPTYPASPSSDPWGALPVLPGTDLKTIFAPGRLPEPALTIGKKVIPLPVGKWILSSKDEYEAPATVAGVLTTSADGSTTTTSFPAIRASTFALEGDKVSAVLTFASNSVPAYAMHFFDPEPCLTEKAFVVQRTGYGNETCLYVRRLESPGDSPDPEVRKAVAVAKRIGARIPLGWYELHYAYYENEFRSATVVWPANAMAGDIVAADWLTSMPFKVRGVTVPVHTTASIDWVGR